jgi:hypothetical protein
MTDDARLTRPTTIACAHCSRTVEVGPRWRVPLFCSTNCRKGAFAKKQRGDKPSAEGRHRLRIWAMMQEAGVIPADRPLPMRKQVEQ